MPNNDSFWPCRALFPTTNAFIRTNSVESSKCTPNWIWAFSDHLLFILCCILHSILINLLLQLFLVHLNYGSDLSLANWLDLIIFSFAHRIRSAPRVSDEQGHHGDDHAQGSGLVRARLSRGRRRLPAQRREPAQRRRIPPRRARQQRVPGHDPEQEQPTQRSQ